LSGKRCIVTGGAAGIGIETARALAASNAAVTLAVRRPNAAERVATELRASTANLAIDVRSSIWRISDRYDDSSTAGVVHCTSSSTTRASWPYPSAN
jgi:NAD(P)-dependent dehydrogenase (short-subunit alcohol dehydrogenase family)